MSSESVRLKYPLHSLVWDNDHRQLAADLGAINKTQLPGCLEQLDPRGRTPLLMAIALGHVESVRVLMEHGANADCSNGENWSAVQEAIALRDVDLSRMVLKHRSQQRATKRTNVLPELLERLREAPDFYVEMKWEFSSWVPFVSRLCPSDTYRVWKSGPCVRVDTTLLGFEGSQWRRGRRSFIFRPEGNSAVALEVDHELRQVHFETFRFSEDRDDDILEDQLAHRMKSPLVTTSIDVEKIEFERSKAGFWGWRSDRTEQIDGRDAKVFTASNVQLVTRKRTEHVDEQTDEEHPLHSLLDQGEEVQTTSGPFTRPSFDEYFNARRFPTQGRLHPSHETVRVQKFKATLCLCEQFPLSLQEQVTPIVDLMSRQSAHFNKLKEFISLQLPSGFPVKIEIPLYRVLTARVTFGNPLCCEHTVEGVTMLREGDKVVGCAIDESMFAIPTGYQSTRDVGVSQLRPAEEDDLLLQLAMEESLQGNELITAWEALGCAPREEIRVSDDDRFLQMALEESLRDEEIQRILEMSRLEHEQTQRTRDVEDEELERVLRLSLVEK